jgi:zinc/manganese transport system substrate-binding protein
MATTDVTVAETLSAVAARNRQMVTNHQSFGYFGDRYDFEILGVIIPGGSSIAEPSSAHLADLVAAMEEAGSDVVFIETTETATLADAVTAELGGDARAVELYTESLGEPGSGAETLSGMLITNAHRIAGALA